MSFPLPLPGTPAREAMGDVAHVVEILDPRNVARLPEFSRALRDARRLFETVTTRGGVKPSRVNFICLRADDERWLVSVGPRGGWRRLWNFGKGR